MKIAEFLREDSILPELASADKAGALVELCGALARSQPGLVAGKLAEVLFEREKLGSTGVGEGVAIPHGKLPMLPGLLACFGRSVKGIEFGAIDNKPAHLFFVLFAPENSAGIHLKALARISRLLRGAPLRKAILEAK
ncbi:MAG: PTS sugar transporter subunit IIA, partial [Deltaproteobacteria bacterium]|nr:PTS sugar transporter subunit IIA [Deltaproteobacteria bacterium]